jgi:hypothetical protein
LATRKIHKKNPGLEGIIRYTVVDY